MKNKLSTKIAVERKGKLVQYTTGCTFFLNYPISKISKEVVTPQEINKILDQRISHTRRSGQSGLKINTDHTLWLKDKNSQRRILCIPAGSKEIVINKVTKKVPVFEPCLITYK